MENWRQFVFYANKLSSCPLSLAGASNKICIHVSICLLTMKITNERARISTAIVKKADIGQQSWYQDINAPHKKFGLGNTVGERLEWSIPAPTARV